MLSFRGAEDAESWKDSTSFWGTSNVSHVLEMKWFELMGSGSYVVPWTVLAYCHHCQGGKYDSAGCGGVIKTVLGRGVCAVPGVG